MKLKEISSVIFDDVYIKRILTVIIKVYGEEKRKTFHRNFLIIQLELLELNEKV